MDIMDVVSQHVTTFDISGKSWQICSYSQISLILLDMIEYASKKTFSWASGVVVFGMGFQLIDRLTRLMSNSALLNDEEHEMPGATGAVCLSFWESVGLLTNWC